MKQSIFSFLLIGLLVLSGCKVNPEEDNSTSAAGYVQAQKETQDIDPEENEISEEEELQQSPEDERTIVKFWETVPEMSIDEAKKIIEGKFKSIKVNQAIGTLTDEERMALYVLNSKFYDVYNEKYPYDEDSSNEVISRFSMVLYLEDDFSGDAEEYFRKFSWEKEIFVDNHDIKKWTVDIMEPIDNEGKPEAFPLASRFTYMYGIDNFVDGKLWTFTNKNGRIEMVFYPENEKNFKTIKFSEFHKELLRYYLSLEEVAYLEGPIFHTLVEII